MTTQQINILRNHAQLNKLLSGGAFIAERTQPGSQVLLFQVQHFYVEVFFNLSGLEIQEIIRFDNLEQLDPYLEAINISGLF